ncbi:LamG domain-containing protein [bacterium]|nr:LamG domain-containing protein [bacterium]
MNRIFLYRLISIIYICFSFLAKAGEFELKINTLTELNNPWPLIASVPFAKGEVNDPSAIRIMSQGKEVPSQIDIAAQWQDGSIRWALAGFTASPQGKYSVEYGQGITRGAYPNPLKVVRQDNGSFNVDTGAAVYQFDADKLLPETAWLTSGGSKIPILNGSGAGVYLVDNQGRTARVAGPTANIENKFIKEGPGRLVLKRSGWYVTASGERLAKADIWIYFSANVPYIRVTHSIIFTENTNKVWFKDYGLEFKTSSTPTDVYCSLNQQGKEVVRKVATNSNEIYLLQDTYVHFAEKECRGTIGRFAEGKLAPVENISVAGDWAYGDYGNYGITIVMPWLAERFPKEIAFGPQGARSVFWSGRCGRELDFRAKTIVKEYLQSWAELALKSPKDKDLDAVKSNAQGAARTHDMWFLPSLGGYNESLVKATASAASKPPLVLTDTAQLCKTEAMGFPMHHKDVKQFPEEEALLSDLWDRFIIPLYAFPMNGYIAWGCFPDRNYGSYNDRAMSIFHVISSLREYGVRREPWRLYARSGERRYYNWGHKFSRFTGDWFLVHSDAPGKEKGTFIPTQAGRGLQGKLPLFWGHGNSWPFVIDAGDIGHWFLEYCLTGDEYSCDLLYMIRDSFKQRGWRPRGTPQQFHATGIRTLVTLMMLDWDPGAMRAAKSIVKETVDLRVQNALRLFEDGYGPQYKDMRASHNILEYYLETGDEVAKEGFLKLIDQRYRFDRRYRAIAYKNYDAFTGSIGYWISGDERHRTVAEQALKDMLYYGNKNPLAEHIQQKPKNVLDWPNLYVTSKFGGPRSILFLGHYEYHNPFIGIPTVLKLISDNGWSGKTTPLIVKPIEAPEGKILFTHKKGEETRLNLFVKTGQPDRTPEVRLYTSGKIIENIKVEKEAQQSSGPFFQKRPALYPPTGLKNLSVSVIVPASVESGFYLLSLADEDTFTLLDSTSAKTALYCPEGFWSVSVGQHTGSKPYGRSGEGMPVFFYVPEGLKELEVFIGRPFSIKTPDGTIALEASNNTIGKVTIPVNNRHGIWSIEYHINSFTGMSTPVFAKLLNVEPIVSFGSPDILPQRTGKSFKKLYMPTVSNKPQEFVPGVTGQALRLSAGNILLFDRGDRVVDGGDTYFPGTTGTVEFWFKADRSTYDMPMRMGQTINNNFVKGPFISLLHTYSGTANAVSILSFLSSRLFSNTSKNVVAGFEATHFLRANQWTHIAYTWDIKEGSSKMEGELNTFVNGKKLGLASGKLSYYPLQPVAGVKKFKLADESKVIEVGPFEGAIDSLHISDIVRYQEDFTPSQTIPIIDDNTRALFSFDGNLEGVSAFSKGPLKGVITSSDK